MNMVRKIIVDDYISDIKKILRGPKSGREEILRKFIYRFRKINNRHFQKSLTVEQTVGRLLEPGWLWKVRDFDPRQWRRVLETVRRRGSKIMESPAEAHLLLYPGFGRFNGRVYRLDGHPVIGCAPDFPRCSGDNLKVLLAHEYAHFVRWAKIGVPPESNPIYAMIYEEGWAVWLSMKLLPELDTNRLFMSNLHGLIGMPNPAGGYRSWCRKHLQEIISRSRKVLGSKTDKDLATLFQCRRFQGDETPIRVGYYLGYRMIEMLVNKNRMELGQLLAEKPTLRKVSRWLGELEDHSHKP